MIPTPLSSLNGLTGKILKTDLDLIKWFWKTTFLIMVLPPVFENSFLHEAIINIISEIMIQISHFQNLRKNFLKEALIRYSEAVLWNSLSAEAKSAHSIYCFKRLI
jgi:replication initiation and membrane attachment protein DnaB